jgi:hypothetical protein
MSYRDIRVLIGSPLLLLFLAGSSWSRDLEGLEILTDNYPRVFFFRAAEGAYNSRRFPNYDSWDQQFERLQGIIGKCLDEECLGRQRRNPQFFSRFKRDHPSQVVLLHFNGNARDPRYKTEKYFPGHWIYRRATTIIRDVPSESGTSLIHVQDASDFRVKTGRYKTSNDDIALFGISGEGKHNWDACEQVQLLEVDTNRNTIKVKRGCYGTKPLRFVAGQARAAAHRAEGPWGTANNLMWFYNHSTHCPRDHEGKTCSDRLVDDLYQWFGQDGVLGAFDGLEFDVLHHQTRGDTDGDGQEDHGVFNGRNEYGIGVVEFANQLRTRMTNNFIIQADGALGPGGAASQRAFGILNGIESEGFPNLGDWEFDDWSGGLNRHFFWRDNARPPVFNYVNHKWSQSVPGRPGVRKQPEIPFSRHRLSFAACQFFDAMTCYSFPPPDDPNGVLGIWDEFRRGVDNELGWLGRPEGPVVRLACQSPDRLDGCGNGACLKNLVTGSVITAVTPQGLKIWPIDSGSEELRFTLRDVRADGANLLVAVEMSAESLTGYPADVARLAKVSASGGVTNLMAKDPTSIGMRFRGGREVPLDHASGASLGKAKCEILGVELPAYLIHPPHRNKKGYTFWTQRALVPENSELRFSLGMGELSPERSDGVQFEVHAAVIEPGADGDFVEIFRKTTNQHRWQPQAVSLAAFAKRQVQFKFVADCGPNDNATTDHARWGDVKIAQVGLADHQVTEEKQYMTWVNNRLFKSYFYFHHIKSPKVDLDFQIEGPEPVVLKGLTAHAAADAMLRVFEGGIVIANPSREEYTFDLQALAPGRRYRRIQATSRQDVEANNGKSVGRYVTLGERDALFLVREPQ